MGQIDYRGNEDEYAYYGRLAVRDYELLRHFSSQDIAVSIVWVVEKKRKTKTLWLEELASTAEVELDVLAECCRDILLLEQKKVFAEECATLVSLKNF